MPGNVQQANPSTVLPYSLCSAFSETRQLATRLSGPYSDGRDQRAALATTSRKLWRLGKRLTLPEWTALRNFFLARKGSVEPFWFYPVKAEHDPTGISSIGRFTVRFEGALSETYSMSRSDVGLRLVEIA